MMFYPSMHLFSMWEVPVSKVSLWEVERGGHGCGHPCIWLYPWLWSPLTALLGLRAHTSLSARGRVILSKFYLTFALIQFPHL